MLGEWTTYGNLWSSYDQLDKTLTKLCLSLHYNHDNSYLFVNGKEIYKFKINNRGVNFPTQFSLESLSVVMLNLEKYL